MRLAGSLLALALWGAAPAAWARQAAPPAAAPPAAAPPATGIDPRVDELIARQKQLEDEVRRQDALLRTLRERSGSSATEQPDGRYGIGPALKAADADLAAPIAGYSWKNFFLRDRHSYFVLVPKGRINVDWVSFLNRPHPPMGVEPNSAADPRSSLRDGVFLRRARIGLAGTIARVIDFRVEAELANLPQPGQYATLADASGVINLYPWLKLEAGQFYSPFTLENQTSENFTDFMEKASVVRWAVPNTRDTGGMAFGEAPHAIVRYWAGVFDGDGQNFRNQDNQPAVLWRVVLAPLGFLPRHAAWMEEVWVGGSFWWQRSDNLGGAGPPSTGSATPNDLPGFATQGGFGVFSSNYANGSDALQNAIRSHLAPNGNTWKYALEVNVPVLGRYGLRSEYVHQSIDLREYDDLNPGNGNLTRSAGAFGNLAGWGAYVEVYAWVGGDVNPDHPGLYSVPHWSGYVPPHRPSWALQLAAKYEHVEWDITDLPPMDPAAGHYGLDSFALAANFWVTRHARLMANHVMNYVGMGDPGLSAANEKKNLFYQRLEHELLFRLQVNL